MAKSDKDVQILQALIAAREEHKELAELLDFYYDLYEVQFEAKAEIADPEMRDELAMRWRLEGGIPQLTFDQMGIETEYFGRLVERITQVLERHNPGWERAHEVQPAEFVTMAREVFESWDTLTAPRSDAQVGSELRLEHPTALTVGFALAPYLQRAAEALLPHLDLSIWTYSYCPICGGRPNLALLEPNGTRQLLCSRCNALWPYSRVGCPFCRSKELQRYYPSEDGAHRLYVCPVCHHYLKTVVVELHPTMIPVIERLLTVGIDLVARQQEL